MPVAPNSGHIRFSLLMHRGTTIAPTRDQLRLRPCLWGPKISWPTATRRESERGRDRESDVFLGADAIDRMVDWWYGGSKTQGSGSASVAVGPFRVLGYGLVLEDKCPTVRRMAEEEREESNGGSLRRDANCERDLLVGPEWPSPALRFHLLVGISAEVCMTTEEMSLCLLNEANLPLSGFSSQGILAPHTHPASRANKHYEPPAIIGEIISGRREPLRRRRPCCFIH